MKTILLATDGSPSAGAATAEAIELASALGAKLVAVSVEDVSVPGYGYYGYGELYADLAAGEHEHAQRVLAEAAHQAGDAGVDCETICVTGAIVEEICRIARDREAALIVLGTHGWGLIRRLVFGSVSTGVLHEADRPVLVVPGTAAEAEVERVRADAAVI
jgi:nucleotide-binding universal stress UspA family protein